MKYKNILEEELKTRVAEDYFAKFDNKTILGKIDFCVKDKQDTNHFLWAEAKRSIGDVYKTFTQLILTIGKARTFDSHLPPPFLGVFDHERIAFIPYESVVEVFYQNDFNWNITSSNYDTKEFNQIYNLTKEILEKNKLEFYFESDDTEIAEFIKVNFVLGKIDATKIKIDKNNFINIYSKWLIAVKPTIAIDWESVKKVGVMDSDFYLADILSEENHSIKDKLHILLEQNKYKLIAGLDKFSGLLNVNFINFNDGQKAHDEFWRRYERPPIEEYWSYIIDRRDLLVPQDVRERKGSFFTPSMWVELSQQYITDVLGDDWQDEYVVWDCAAGTGNLLAGLTNKYNIYASTLDIQDVKVMHERIQSGANLLEVNVFQFDFLNDSFDDDKVPASLKEILRDEEKRKKLLIYINPPYAEHSNMRTLTSGGEHKTGVSISKIKDKYQNILGMAGRELYSIFLTRIYDEIKGCKIGEFSKLKTMQTSSFIHFREFFLPKLEKMFIMPADTFDNVKGQFPIGFKIWDTNKQEKFTKITTDIFNENRKKICRKKIYSYDGMVKINKWLSVLRNRENVIAYISMGRNDLQHTNLVFITSLEEKATNFYCCITANNLIIASIYLAVHRIIKPTWLNDRDQFLTPNKKWLKDSEFQSDCLAYTLFHNSNNIQAKHGTNHFIPFNEYEVDAKQKFASNFMSNFIKGKIKGNSTLNINETVAYYTGDSSISFSNEAQAVFNAGQKLFTYYHSKPNIDVNAGYYDIREFFCGRSDGDRLNHTSNDELYNKLHSDLKFALDNLASKIEPKIYEYGFLLE